MSAATVVNGVTEIRPSSTVEPAGSAAGRTRIPNGWTPARGVLARGGEKVTVTVPSTPGNSDRDGGSTRTQPVVGPTTSTSNRSTIEPALRILMVIADWPPGSTVGSARDREVTALIRGSLRGAAACECPVRTSDRPVPPRAPVPVRLAVLTDAG